MLHGLLTADSLPRSAFVLSSKVVFPSCFHPDLLPPAQRSGELSAAAASAGGPLSEPAGRGFAGPPHAGAAPLHHRLPARHGSLPHQSTPLFFHSSRANSTLPAFASSPSEPLSPLPPTGPDPPNLPAGNPSMSAPSPTAGSSSSRQDPQPAVIGRS